MVYAPRSRSTAASTASRCSSSWPPISSRIYVASVPSHSGQGCCRFNDSSPRSWSTWKSAWRVRVNSSNCSCGVSRSREATCCAFHVSSREQMAMTARVTLLEPSLMTSASVPALYRSRLQSPYFRYSQHSRSDHFHSNSHSPGQ